jgi:hypothetical protein
MSRWNSIGPSVVKKAQGGTQPDTSGRTTGIAVAKGGNLIYLATANGGVWRSDDTGKNWRSLMDAFDLNPQHRASDSLACGAIAIDLDNPDLVYVGTGDGPGSAYFGVGPIVSDDGGDNWTTESVASGSPQLAGSAFYALAIDPMNSNRVVAGTKLGVYRREPNGSSFHWARKNLANGKPSTSVVYANKNGVTTFFAAHYNSKVFSSTDGDSWSELGTGFPTGSVSQVRLAVQQDNPDILYALVARTGGSFRGVWRWNRNDNVWRQISGGPSDLFGPSNQGGYDIAISVDPNDDGLIYLGGATKVSRGEWSGSVYRSTVTNTGSSSTPSYRMNNVYIGNSVHADIHNLVFTPGDSEKLWLGCDGGIFYSTNPKAIGSAIPNMFSSRNNGLSTLMMEHMGMHPTDSDVLFCGTQDNGGLKFTGNSEWLYSSGGDAGFQVVNWHNPSKILSSYVYQMIRYSTNGGTRSSYTSVDIPIAIEPVEFYAPLVGTPYRPSDPIEAEIVAFGSIRPWISTDFGRTWESIPNNVRSDDALRFVIRSLVFASATKLYAGTRGGEIYRFDNTASGWTRTQLDTLGGTNNFPLNAIVTDIAVDLSDPTGNSIYISLAGTGDYRHVWHFDGTEWQQRSGPSNVSSQKLLDVQTSAIAVDPINTNTIYAGMDIGCWRSTDGGMTWDVFSEGLPDSAIMDLKTHPSGIIRASTHGRGVFERSIIQSATTTPDNPTGLSSIAISSTQIDLNWISPSNDGGSSIIGYNLQRKFGFTNWIDIPLGDVTFYSDTGLTPNTAYEYRVSAVNSVGIGDVSGTVSSTTLSSGSGGSNAPTNFKATGINISQINLSWDPPNNVSGSITYEIKGKLATATTWMIRTSGLSARTFSDQNLIKGKEYDYEITATTSTGISSPSSTSGKTKTCFILTATYGSELETKAYYVHEFIDDVLLKSRFKEQFNSLLRFYFRFSPPIANLMNKNKPFKYFMKYSVTIPFLAIAKIITILIKPFVRCPK